MKIFNLLILGAAPALADWNIVFYSGPDCTGEAIDSDNVKPDQDATCRAARPSVALARSASVSSTEPFMSRAENGLYQSIRFYDNDDCSHSCKDRHAIPSKAWRPCITWPAFPVDHRIVKSYGIVEQRLSNDDDGVLSDGYCLFAHGDSLHYNGRLWKMQQVAAAYFHEIAAEDWNDATHVQNTTHRWPQHGDVDINGIHKYWQREFDYLEKVNLEMWNETRHVKKGKYARTVERFQSLLQKLCVDASETEERLERNQLFENVPHLKPICSEKSIDDWKQQRQGLGHHEEALGVPMEWIDLK